MNTPILYYAIVNEKREIVKFLLQDKRLLWHQIINHTNLFEYVIIHNDFELAELLLQNHRVKIIGEISQFQSDPIFPLKVEGNWDSSELFKLEFSFSENFPHFLLKDSQNKIVEQKKKEIIHELVKNASFTDFEKYIRFIELPTLEPNKEINSYSSSYKKNYQFPYSILLLIHYFTIYLSPKNENIKKEIIIDNIAFFTCLAAQYLNENEFAKFLDDYKVDDINLIEEKSI